MNSSEFTETLELFHKTASEYAPTSKEYEAIKVAADALIFVYSRNIGTAFLEFVSNRGKDLTPSQREHLKSLGLDPD